REGLAERVLAGGGTDVLHLGFAGTTVGAADALLLLEQSDGSPDLVSVDGLVAQLRPARNRIKLVVLSAGQSAAASTAQTLAWLQLDEAADKLRSQIDAADWHTATVASRIAAELDCAVLAMRYPVRDEFAVRLSERLYEALFGQGLPVD